MKTVYVIDASRNKFDAKKQAPTSIKKRLIEKRGPQCYLCKKSFDRTNELEVEHKIPVFVGGHLVSEENLELCCKRCHREKTILDKKVIILLRKMKVIEGKYWRISFFLERQKVIELYLNLKKILLETEEVHEKYWNGKIHQDYETVLDKSNRTEDLVDVI